MSDFPPRDYLAHVARAISRRLTEDCAYLLGTEHFAEEAALLERLRRPEHLAQGVEAMQPAEAARLAERLLARWGRIGEVELEPAVAILGPDDVWLSDQPCKITLRLATLGVEEGWNAHWMGDLSVAEDGHIAELKLEPPVGEEPVTVTLGVRLMGRAEDERCVLSAQRCIEVRRAIVRLDERSCQLQLKDQTGRAGAGVDLKSGDWEGTTGIDGTVRLPELCIPERGIRVGPESMAAWVALPGD